jgi:DNA polymerase III delta prime subunit
MGRYARSHFKRLREGAVMSEKKIQILAIVGPTASGKTAVAVELARRLGGEVVSCDSMQVYRRMDIGTAKPTIEEMCGIPHHLIDAVEPDAPFSCAEYVSMASEAVKDIAARGKLPILCGGTGLYLDRFLCGEMEETHADEALRASLFAFAEREMAGNYDFVFADIWHDAGDGRDLYLRMKELAAKHPDMEFSFWLEDTIRCYLDEDLWDIPQS